VKERSDFKKLLGEYLFRTTKPDDSSYEPFWLNLTDTVSTVMTHCYFSSVKIQFLGDIVRYFVNSVFELLFQQICSYSVGIQVKMLIEFIERWISDCMKKFNLNSDISDVELEPLRQAANTLLFRQKGDLLKPDIRQAVCALFRPLQISQILDGYRPDEFDITALPDGLVDKIAKQDSIYTLPNSFDPQLSKALSFHFKMETLLFDKLEIPKVILDKPAFSFLKRNPTQNQIVSPW